MKQEHPCFVAKDFALLINAAHWEYGMRYGMLIMATYAPCMHSIHRAYCAYEWSKIVDIATVTLLAFDG